MQKGLHYCSPLKVLKLLLEDSRSEAGMTSYRLNFFNRSVVLLKRLHGAVAVAGGGDALHGVVGTGEGRDVRNLVLDGSLTDSALDSSSPKCGARK